MATNKKYDFRVFQNNAGEADAAEPSWSAEITRRATALKTVVSKSQGGFATEEEAKAWAEKELAVFLEIIERNKRKKKK